MTHSGIWAQTLVNNLRKHGIRDTAIVGNTGIDLSVLDNDDPVMSFAHLALLFERAEELTDDGLIGFELGLEADFRQAGLIAYTGMTSPTVRSFLCNLSRYQRITGDVIETNIDKLGDQGVFEWYYRVPLKVRRNQYVEFNSALLIRTLQRLTNRSLAPLAVEFRHFKTANTKPLCDFFRCRVAFGAKVNRVTFKLSDLDLPLSSADDRLFRILRKVSEEAIGTRGQPTRTLVTDVEERIATDLSKSQADVAKEIGMSTRTLARRLSNEGTTFSSIVEDYREAMAKTMLTDTVLSMTEVAFVLGYASPSAFSTAFKRWVDCSPKEFRRKFGKQ